MVLTSVVENRKVGFSPALGTVGAAAEVRPDPDYGYTAFLRTAAFGAFLLGAGIQILELWTLDSRRYACNKQARERSGPDEHFEMR